MVKMLRHRPVCVRRVNFTVYIISFTIGMYLFFDFSTQYGIYKGTSALKEKSINRHLTTDIGHSKGMTTSVDKSTKVVSLIDMHKHLMNRTNNLSLAHSGTIAKDVEASDKVRLFQPIEEEEFPTTDDKEPRIPHIIHQMYKDEIIPEKYVPLVKSFIKYNPTWEYRFWTDKSGRELLQKHHPYLVNVYNRFGNNVKRSDMLRYAVLYEYGGFYADFDVENFRPLNKTTLKYACIFPVEPFEHSALLYNKPFIINNAFMGCRPKHPFLKLLLNELRGAITGGDPVATTGPGYVTQMYIRYNRIGNTSLDKNKTDWSSNSPYFYKGQLQETDNNAVYVPNSQYFMDKVDPYQLSINGQITKSCRNVRILSILQQRACFELSSRVKIRANRRYTYTVHHWYHLWLNKKEVIDRIRKVNISSVVPNFTQYHDV